MESARGLHHGRDPLRCAAHRPAVHTPALRHYAKRVFNTPPRSAQAVVEDSLLVRLRSSERGSRVGPHDVALQGERLVAHQKVGQLRAAASRSFGAWQDVADLYLSPQEGSQIGAGEDPPVALAAVAADTDIGEPVEGIQRCKDIVKTMNELRQPCRTIVITGGSSGPVWGGGGSVLAERT